MRRHQESWLVVKWEPFRKMLFVTPCWKWLKQCIPEEAAKVLHPLTPPQMNNLQKQVMSSPPFVSVSVRLSLCRPFNSRPLWVLVLSDAQLCREAGEERWQCYFMLMLSCMCTKLPTITLRENLLQSPWKRLISPKNHFKGKLKGRMKNRLFIGTEMLCWQEQKPWEGSVWECVCVCALLCTEQMRNPKWDLYTLLTMNLFSHGCYDFRKENSDLYKTCM